MLSERPKSACCGTPVKVERMQERRAEDDPRYAIVCRTCGQWYDSERSCWEELLEKQYRVQPEKGAETCT